MSFTYAFMIGVVIGASMVLMCLYLLSLMFYEEDEGDRQHD